MKTMSRRTVLRGASGLAVPLPFLDAMMRPRVAQAQSAITKTGPNGAPKRFIVFFTPCGQGADWLKNKNGADGKLALAPALAPLERHKADLLFLDGVNNRSALFADGSSIDSGHEKPMGNLMSCVATAGGKVGGITIDQAIARELGATTKLPSLHLSDQPAGGQIRIIMSYGPTGLPVPATSDPSTAWKKLFSTTTSSPMAMDKLAADRKSVLDGIKQDYSAFVNKVSGDDRIKVQAHLDGLRDLEKRVTALTPAVPAASCTAPAAPAMATSQYSAAQYIAVGKAHMDLIATAVACDLTRVATLLFEGAGGNITLPGFGMGLHDASHVYGAPGWPLRNQYTTWFCDYFAGFLDKLKGLKEAGGSVFDNTVLFWCSEHGAGNHNYDWMTMLVAGSGGGYFKTGRQISYPNMTTGLDYKQYSQNDGCTGPSQAELYVSFMNAMGIPASTFGKPDLCRGPLPGLAA